MRRAASTIASSEAKSKQMKDGRFETTYVISNKVVRYQRLPSNGITMRSAYANPDINASVSQWKGFVSVAEQTYVCNSAGTFTYDLYSYLFFLSTRQNHWLSYPTSSMSTCVDDGATKLKKATRRAP